MTFEYRNTDGDELHASPITILTAEGTAKGAQNQVALLIKGPDGTAGICIPLDRVEEVVAGIRDAARQASGQQPDGEERYTAEVVQAARRRYEAEPKCPNCEHLWKHHGEEVCGVRSRHQGTAYNCGCTDAEEDHAPVAGLSDTQPTVDRAAVRERVRLAIAKQWIDETGSGRTVDELDDFEFGTLADAVLAALGKTTTPAVEGDEAHTCPDGEPCPGHDQPALTSAERKFLHFALDEAAEEMSYGDGFTDEDQAALDRLRLLAGKDER
ncbi:hypothetical protein [Streptomyces gardneri]|uniref:hypothetical protein n=1 Tax=Streptomyces gardneri TaxID=66892 RepID=UPI0033CC8C7B